MFQGALRQFERENISRYQNVTNSSMFFESNDEIGN